MDAYDFMQQLTNTDNPDLPVVFTVDGTTYEIESIKIGTDDDGREQVIIHGFDQG